MAETRRLAVNLYSYANNNPLVFVDVAGLAPVESAVTGCDPHAIPSAGADSVQSATAPTPTSDSVQPPSTRSATPDSNADEDRAGSTLLTKGQPAHIGKGEQNSRIAEFSASGDKQLQTHLRFSGETSAYGYTTTVGPEGSQVALFTHWQIPNTRLGGYVLPYIGYAKTDQGDRTAVVGAQAIAAASAKFKGFPLGELQLDANLSVEVANYFKPATSSSHKIYSTSLSGATILGGTLTATVDIGRVNIIAEASATHASGRAVTGSDQKTIVNAGSLGLGVMGHPFKKPEVFGGIFGGVQWENQTHPIVTEGPIINKADSTNPFISIVIGYKF
jgi:hypothetical protein